ncbi:MAG: permease, partial [Candidatus Krumholzibacteria bacterium]|nr:permease [Candidatus Krumholzibacteria bacterium]
MVEIASALVLGSWETLREMAPYLLFGFLIAGGLSVLIQPEVVERHLGGKGMWQVIKAALFGVPLPLCSCGVIPVAASLRRHGAGEGATTSFLISTPQTGVDSVLVTFSLLGPVFAVFRPLVSFFSGLIGGALVSYYGAENDSKAEKHPVCREECCAWPKNRTGLVRALRYGFVTLPRDLNKALIIGILLAGVISAIVPDDYFSIILGGGIVSMLVMMVAGIPVYVCATASIPIAAALIAKG